MFLDPEPAQFEDPEDERSEVSVEDYAPHILVFSSGDMTAFELRILQKELDQTIALESNLLGDIKFKEEDAP